MISIIKEVPNGKAPGPDDFTAEFFKLYASELTPLLLDMYNEKFEHGELPATLSKAFITLILKKDKNSYTSYGPISLSRVDAVIFV